MFGPKQIASWLLVGYATTTLAQTCSSNSEQVLVTFYGWPDNDPPGPGIACEIEQRTSCDTCSPSSNTTIARQCGPRGETAGGDGSYANPLTMASSGRWFCHQEVVYLPYVRKYLRYEDYCQQCIDDARAGRPIHIDLWTGSNQRTGGRLQIECENTLTPSRTVEMIRNPRADLSVDASDLFTRTGNGTGLCNGMAVNGDTEFAPGSRSGSGSGRRGAASTIAPSIVLSMVVLLPVLYQFMSR